MYGVGDILGLDHLAEVGEVGACGFDHVRGDSSGADCVNANGVFSALFDGGFCEADERMFAGSVGRLVGVAFYANDGGDVDDSSAVLWNHLSHCLLEAEEGPFDIYFLNRLPFVQRNFRDWIEATHARVIDEEIEMSDGFKKGLDVCLLGHVRQEC